MIDGFEKSRRSPIDRHSGLSGIVLKQYIIWQYDSRQAGVTTFYESIMIKHRHWPLPVDKIVNRVMFINGAL